MNCSEYIKIGLYSGLTIICSGESIAMHPTRANTRRVRPEKSQEWPGACPDCLLCCMQGSCAASAEIKYRCKGIDIDLYIYIYVHTDIGINIDVEIEIDADMDADIAVDTDIGIGLDIEIGICICTHPYM